MDAIKVRAVQGRMLPKPEAPNQYVGWVECDADDKDVGHVIPLGIAKKKRVTRSFKLAGAVTVPNDRYHRAALRRGDLMVEESTSKRSKKSSEGGEL
jgi:hypothetical protein